jgi:hypothetical protein
MLAYVRKKIATIAEVFIQLSFTIAIIFQYIQNKLLIDVEIFA